MNARCGLWLRVSTSEQDVSNQEPELLALVQRRGFEVAKVYRLEGESAYCGSTGYRRQLDSMLADARRGEFQVLACWSLDRLSREGALATLGLRDQLGRAAVSVVSVQESWTEVGSAELRELLVAIVGWVARMESQRRSERTKAGLERARGQGEEDRPAAGLQGRPQAEAVGVLPQVGSGAGARGVGAGAPGSPR